MHENMADYYRDLLCVELTWVPSMFASSTLFLLSGTSKMVGLLLVPCDIIWNVWRCQYVNVRWVSSVSSPLKMKREANIYWSAPFLATKVDIWDLVFISQPQEEDVFRCYLWNKKLNLRLGIWDQSENCFLGKHQDLSIIPQSLCWKSWVWQPVLAVPALGMWRQWIPGGWWPASVDRLASSRFHERPYLNKRSDALG